MGSPASVSRQYASRGLAPSVRQGLPFQPDMLAVVHPGRRELRRPGAGRFAVQQRQLANQNGERPEVGDDVVNGQEEHRPAGAAHQQSGAKERPALQVEGAPGFFGQTSPQRLLAPTAGIHARQGEALASRRPAGRVRRRPPETSSARPRGGPPEPGTRAPGPRHRSGCARGPRPRCCRRRPGSEVLQKPERTLAVRGRAHGADRLSLQLLAGRGGVHGQEGVHLALKKPYAINDKASTAHPRKASIQSATEGSGEDSCRLRL